MATELPELSQAEWTIMKKVWSLKKTNVREVFEELRDSEGWAYNTVRTMMERLCDKGYLVSRKVGNMFFYEPATPRRRTVLAAIDRFAERVFDGAVGPVVTHLIRQDRLSEDEIGEIRRLIDKDHKGEAS